jgi:cytoskeletal protein RodZ
MKPNQFVRQVTKAKKRSAKRFRIGLLVSAVLLALLGGTLILSRDTSQASTQRQQKRYIATREVIADETTGQRRKPTAEEIETIVAQVTALTNRSTEGLTPTSRPDGSTMVNLENRFSNVTLGRVNEDGTIEVRCVTSMEEAAEFLGLVEEGQ